MMENIPSSLAIMLCVSNFNKHFLGSADYLADISHSYDSMRCFGCAVKMQNLSKLVPSLIYARGKSWGYIFSDVEIKIFQVDFVPSERLIRFVGNDFLLPLPWFFNNF